MFVYLGIYTTLAISAIGNYDRRHTIFFLLSGLFLLWFMGFRFQTGCDYYGYSQRWINFQPPEQLTDLLQGEEAGFAFMMGALKAYGYEYTSLNVVASAILIFCYIKFAKAHPFAPLILTLLFPVIIIQLGMSGLRQAIAGGFLMLAFNSFAKGSKIWTAAWILVGMQFHASVIMFLPIAFLAGREVNTFRLAISLAFLGPVVAILLADRFDTYENRYIEGSVVSGGAIIRYALMLIPIPFFVFNTKKIKLAFPEVYPLLKLGALTIIALAPLIVLSSIALHRLNYYVMPLSILIFAYAAAAIFRNTRNGHALAILAYGGYSFFWFLSSRHATYCYVPYDNTWFY